MLQIDICLVYYMVVRHNTFCIFGITHMKGDSNRYIERLETLDKARKIWSESEWRLSFLRKETGQPSKQLTDEELLQWYQQNPR